MAKDETSHEAPAGAKVAAAAFAATFVAVVAALMIYALAAG